MTGDAADFWTDETSVLFTSYWGWTPEIWGTVGWTGDRGHTRRENLLKILTDPFITVAYVTSNSNPVDREVKGKIAGFYLMSHERRDRDEFTHPTFYDHEPTKWRHSLRALCAFSYLPEHRMAVADLNPAYLDRARHIAAMGEVLTDRREIDRLRNTPWVEVAVYTPTVIASAPVAALLPSRGQVKAGPANEGGYVVSAAAEALGRQLYILRLGGDADAYLGRPAKGRRIYKIGLSVSPEMRRQTFQMAMPRGAFVWQTYRPAKLTGTGKVAAFAAAVAGEDAMKTHLAKTSEWLGGEFYLAAEADIEKAWKLGQEAVKSFLRKK